MTRPRARRPSFLHSVRIAIVAVVLAFGVTEVDVAPARAEVRPTAVTECLFTDHDRRQLEAAEAALGRSVRCASVGLGRPSSWAQWSSPWFVGSRYDYFRWDAWVHEQPGRRLVIDVPLIPHRVPADWRARGARGEFDAHAAELASTLVRAGLDRSVIRLGPPSQGSETDGPGRTVQEHRDRAAYWARIAHTMGAVPGARFVFEFAVGPQHDEAQLAAHYPGDDAVDVIGIDAPDRAPGASAPDGLGRSLPGRAEMDRVAAFAGSRGKPSSLRSALVSQGAGGNGDNPDHVRDLSTWVAARRVAYVGLVSSNAEGGLKLHQVPQSRAAWRGSFTGADTLDDDPRRRPSPTGVDPSTEATQCPYVDHDLRRLPVVAEQLGSPVRCALVFHDYMRTWEEWERPWFANSQEPRHQWERWVADSGGRNRLVMTLNLVPTQAPPDWRTRGARGEYDPHIRTLAENLVARGLGESVVRLGSEANGDWRPDRIGDTVAQQREWARYWARFVRVTRTVPGARFTFDWTINAGYRPVPFEQYYPGDDVVDIIGIDQYDSLPAPRTSNRWADLSTQPGGILELAAFARRHGKPVSLPEVGLVSTARYGAGDDPTFVTALRSVVQGQDTAYIGYFDKSVDGTLTLQQVPRSAAEWRRRFTNGDRLDGVVRESLSRPREG